MRQIARFGFFFLAAVALLACAHAALGLGWHQHPLDVPMMFVFGWAGRAKRSVVDLGKVGQLLHRAWRGVFGRSSRTESRTDPSRGRVMTMPRHESAHVREVVSLDVKTLGAGSSHAMVPVYARSGGAVRRGRE